MVSSFSSVGKARSGGRSCFDGDKEGVILL